MGSTKGSIYGVNFGYNVKNEVYPNSSLDIPKLYAIVSKRLKSGLGSIDVKKTGKARGGEKGGF